MSEAVKKGNLSVLKKNNGVEMVIEGLTFNVYSYQDAVQFLNDLGNARIQGKISDESMKSMGWLIQMMYSGLGGMKEEVKLSKMEKKLDLLLEQKGVK